MSPLTLKAKIIFYTLTANPTFIIQIKAGVVTKVSGNIKGGFLKDCIDIVSESQLQYGVIYATKGQYGMPALKASGEIPADTLQKFRNAWSFYA